MDVKKEIIRVLKKNKKPMTCSQIHKSIIKRGKLKLRTATPNASICSIIVVDMMKGDKSYFVRVSRGYYNLK